MSDEAGVGEDSEESTEENSEESVGDASASDESEVLAEPESDGASDGAAESSVPQLSAIELRVLGALMEKQLTTPDQYPLTVNSILTACNQKSSREPVTSYHQGELVRTIQALEDKGFVRKEYSSRADKYSQLFIRHLDLGKKQQAVLCVMMLRGPQTLSELSTRTQRMEQYHDRDDLTHCVERLCEREIPYVIRLGQQPGQRGERFTHLFSGTPDVGQSAPAGSSLHSRVAATPTVDPDVLAVLELEVAELKEKLQQTSKENALLRRQLEALYELTGHSLPDGGAS